MSYCYRGKNWSVKNGIHIRKEKLLWIWNEITNSWTWLKNSEDCFPYESQQWGILSIRYSRLQIQKDFFSFCECKIHVWDLRLFSFAIFHPGRRQEADKYLQWRLALAERQDWQLINIRTAAAGLFNNLSLLAETVSSFFWSLANRFSPNWTQLSWLCSDGKPGKPERFCHKKLVSEFKPRSNQIIIK